MPLAETIASPSKAVLRFAPSPTGHLHLGHALSALTNEAMARSLAGRLLIRIENTDLDRCRPEFEGEILDQLRWLGIEPDGPVLRQSEHLADYAAAADRLAAMGLLYPCFATRQEVAAAALPGMVDPDGAPIYPGIWRDADRTDVERRLSSGEAHAMRLNMVRAIEMAREQCGGSGFGYTAFNAAFAPYPVRCHPERWGDVVIMRKGGLAAYHLAVVVDDDRQGISHVVRGADLRAATDVHRLLQLLLGISAPLYHHHRLLLDRDGRKLSKRAGDTSLAALRAKGLTPDDIRQMVFRGGTRPS